ncbi:MAG: hypothetical protein NWE89_04050 [Candidatus Bathyarchaeota archaeon]|nr:hypothetical protein [Candidatus Bathyarchaeota archaeon]
MSHRSWESYFDEAKSNLVEYWSISIPRDKIHKPIIAGKYALQALYFSRFPERELDIKYFNLALKRVCRELDMVPPINIIEASNKLDDYMREVDIFTRQAIISRKPVLFTDDSVLPYSDEILRWVKSMLPREP